MGVFLGYVTLPVAVEFVLPKPDPLGPVDILVQ
jgi:hypothetical protein